MKQHVIHGGTAITNFGFEQTWMYISALLEYKHKDLHIGLPMDSMSGEDLTRSCLALHSNTPGKFPEAMEEFWSIFKKIRSAEKP